MTFYFSIIIPCYNSWQFMKRGLMSLESQTFKDFEVIFVDDCSTDDTYSQLLNYQQKSDLNIIVLRNAQNAGPGQSRNYAISQAQGKYLVFMDSDDWYEYDCLSQLHHALLSGDSDILLYNYYRSYSSGQKKAINCTQYFSSATLSKEYVALAFESLCSMAINSILVKNNPIPALYNSEDAAVIPYWLSLTDKISFLNSPLYNYLYRTSSLSTSCNKNIYKGFLEAYDFIAKKVACDFAEEKEFRGINLVLYGAVYKALEAKISDLEIQSFVSDFEHLNPCCYQNKYLKYYPCRKRIFLFLVRKQYYFLLKYYCKMQKVILSILNLSWLRLISQPTKFK